MVQYRIPGATGLHAIDRDGRMDRPRLKVLGDGKMQYNNSHVDNTEMIELTSATRSSFTLKVDAKFWLPCSNGSKSTHFVIAWDTLSASELTP